MLLNVIRGSGEKDCPKEEVYARGSPAPLEKIWRTHPSLVCFSDSAPRRGARLLRRRACRDWEATPDVSGETAPRGGEGNHRHAISRPNAPADPGADTRADPGADAASDA
jgi:hypothetical protein